MRILIFAVLWASASGCALAAKQFVEKPTVKLKDVGIKNLTADGATLLFEVSVNNPNPYPINISALSYNVEVDKRAVGAGELENPAQVAANGTSVVPIPVAIKYSDLLSSVTDLFRKKASPYRIKGSARFGLFSLPFEYTGEVKIK